MRCSCSARQSIASIGGESGTIGFVSTTGEVLRRRWTSSPTCSSTRRSPMRALERLRGQRLVALTQARAQPGAIAGRVFPRIAVRRRPSVRPARHRGIAQGHHARRRRRVPQGVLPAGPRARHRRRRRHGRQPRSRRSRRRSPHGPKGGERPRSPTRRVAGAEPDHDLSSSTSRAPRNRRSRSACPDRRAPRRTTTRCR